MKGIHALQQKALPYRRPTHRSPIYNKLSVGLKTLIFPFPIRKYHSIYHQNKIHAHSKTIRFAKHVGGLAL